MDVACPRAGDGARPLMAEKLSERLQGIADSGFDGSYSGYAPACVGDAIAVIAAAEVWAKAFRAWHDDPRNVDAATAVDTAEAALLVLLPETEIR
jgi:uncharacterized protein with beta-barrel porin domain